MNGNGVYKLSYLNAFFSQVIMLFIEEVQPCWMKYCYFRAHNLTPILVFPFLLHVCRCKMSCTNSCSCQHAWNLLPYFSTMCDFIPLKLQATKTPSISCYWECCFTSATEKYVAHAYIYFEKLYNIRFSY